MSASLQKGISVLREVIDAPIASFFESCVHCGLCAESCLFYTESGDPKFTPIHKVEPLRRIYEQEYTLLGRLKKLFGLSKPVTDAELEEWRVLVYDSCTLCGRCAEFCPDDDVIQIRFFGIKLFGSSREYYKKRVKRETPEGMPKQRVINIRFDKPKTENE